MFPPTEHLWCGISTRMKSAESFKQRQLCSPTMHFFKGDNTHVHKDLRATSCPIKTLQTENRIHRIHQINEWGMDGQDLELLFIINDSSPSVFFLNCANTVPNNFLALFYCIT